MKGCRLLNAAVFFSRQRLCAGPQPDCAHLDRLYRGVKDERLKKPDRACLDRLVNSLCIVHIFTFTAG